MDVGSNLVEFPAQMKKCTGCVETKPLEKFPKNKKLADGYSWRCKTTSDYFNRQFNI